MADLRGCRSPLKLPRILGEAQSRGPKIALVEVNTGQQISYAELAEAVRCGAGWLVDVGVRPRDVVALCAPSSIDFVVAWYAALSVGAVITTVNPLSTEEEAASQFERTGTRWLFTTAELLSSKLSEPANRIDTLQGIFVFDNAATQSGDGFVPASDLRSELSVRRFDAVGFGTRAVAYPDGSRGAARGVLPVELGSDDVAWLAPSSGTTGRPKIVELTHRNLVASLDLQLRAQHVTERDVNLALPPMFHVYGQAMLNSALKRGATVVILPRFELELFLRAIEDYHVTRADIVPPVAVMLAKNDLVDDFDLSSLRLLTSAAAPLSIDVARACGKRLGVRVVQAFGMTEAAGGTHFGLDEGPDRPDSVGPALPGIECRVVDPDTGMEMNVGEQGELLIRSPGLMRGYLDDPAATAAAIDADGWLHNGDIVTADSEGWYRVTDRLKELIKYNGYQVAPAELEDVLLAHPGVADAAVVRSPDEAAGEVPKAFVVRQPGAAAVDAEELIAWVAGRVAPYKRVRRVEFTDTIPKSASGKILRRQLIDLEYRAAAQRRDLTGLVVMMSGGGRGLGRMLATELAGDGATVGLLARSDDELAAAVAEIKRAGGTAEAIAVDITDRTSLAAAVGELIERIGEPDVLINNAGITGPIGPLWDVDSDEWARTFEVNVVGAFALTRLVLPGMVARGRGRVINITSNAAVYRWPLVSAYASSKAALVKLSETLAVETARDGVSVLSFDPGLLPIGISAPAMAGGTADPDSAEGRVSAWIRKRIADGHGAEPEQAIRQLVRLSAGDADRLSGRHLTVIDDLDGVLSNIERVERDDLHYLRLRTAR